MSSKKADTKFKKLLVELFNQEYEDNIEREFFHDHVGSSSDDPEWCSDDERLFRQSCKDNGITFESMDHHGGEGQGEDYWAVYKFTKDGESVYIKFDGYYMSYDGSTYDDYYFVEPKEVTRTEYV